MTSYGFRVFDIPAPQGSKIPGVSSKTGKMFVREQSGKALTTWRDSVRRGALVARGIDPDSGDPTPGTQQVATLTGAIHLVINFYMPRPASVSVKKRPLPIVMPDLDKMVRGVGDALKAAGVYKDDAQVCSITATKRYGDDSAQGSPGAWIVVSEIL